METNVNMRPQYTKLLFIKYVCIENYIKLSSQGAGDEIQTYLIQHLKLQKCLSLRKNRAITGGCF